MKRVCVAWVYICVWGVEGWERGKRRGEKSSSEQRKSVKS